MSDELERVARAIATSDQEDYMEDAFVYDRRARAAIDAISEPSDALIEAMVSAMDRVIYLDGKVGKARAAWTAAMSHIRGERK